MSFMDVLKIQFPTEEAKEEDLNEVKEEMEVLEPQTLSSLKTNSELMGYYKTIKNSLSEIVGEQIKYNKDEKEARETTNNGRKEKGRKPLVVRNSAKLDLQDPLNPKERMTFDIPLKGITEAKIGKIVLGELLESIKAKVKRYSEGTIMQPKEKEVVAEEPKIPRVKEINDFVNSGENRENTSFDIEKLSAVLLDIEKTIQENTPPTQDLSMLLDLGKLRSPIVVAIDSAKSIIDKVQGRNADTMNRLRILLQDIRKSDLVAVPYKRKLTPHIKSLEELKNLTFTIKGHTVQPATINKVKELRDMLVQLNKNRNTNYDVVKAMGRGATAKNNYSFLKNVSKNTQSIFYNYVKAGTDFLSPLRQKNNKIRYFKDDATTDNEKKRYGELEKVGKEIHSLLNLEDSPASLNQKYLDDLESARKEGKSSFTINDGVEPLEVIIDGLEPKDVEDYILFIAKENGNDSLLEELMQTYQSLTGIVIDVAENKKMRKELAKLRKEVLASVTQSEDQRTDLNRLLDDVRESGLEPMEITDSLASERKKQKEEEE
tara:strand:+ start:7769 stop:9403 length:1635 start_codon:yes stop_codon:yes gene_type:complete